MYAIGQIIYGLPLVANEDEDSPQERFEILAEACQEECDGFLSYYSGASDESPAAFGVELGQFDECCAYIEAASLPLVPTPEQVAEYARLLDAQEPEVRKALENLGAPRVFFLWSTS